MKKEIQAWLSAVAGACALAISAYWFWLSWDDGLRVPFPGGDMLDVQELLGLAMLGTMFQFGVPALNVPAWLLGIKARRHWAARAGMAMACASLALYAVYIRFVFHLFSENRGQLTNFTSLVLPFPCNLW